jgi:hypothetical protein
VHVRVAGQHAHRRHVRLPPCELLGGDRRRIDVETIAVVIRVVGDAACVEREEVADRLALDVDTEGVDEDEAADPLAAILESHLGCDPATDRLTYDEHVGKVEIAQQVQVGGCQVFDPGEPSRPRRSIPARMRRRDRPVGLGEVPRDRLHGDRPAASMEDQRRGA